MPTTMNDAREAAEVFAGLVTLFNKVKAKKLDEYFSESTADATEEDYNRGFRDGLNKGLKVCQITPHDVDVNDFIAIVFDQSPSEGE